MAVTKLLDEEIQGDVRFHTISRELWIMEARQCSHRWRVFHETYSFCLVLRITSSATVDWSYNHRLYVADPSHVMAMQPGETHVNLRRTPPGDFIVVQVAERLMKEVAAELGWRHSQLNIKHPHPGSNHPALLKALRRIHLDLCRDLFDQHPGRGLCTCRRDAERHLDNLTHLVAVFIQECAENARDIGRPEKGAAQITRAIEYLRAHYNEPYSLERLARAAGCDRFRLSHLFSNVMRMTPWEFQNRILVAKAQRALAAAPDKPLQLIANDVGWPGRSGVSDHGEHLMIKQFSETLGTTPDKFRAALRQISRSARRRGLIPSADPRVTLAGAT